MILTANEAAAFSALLTECRDTGVCPTLSRIQDTAGIPRGSVGAALRRLGDLGLVRQHYWRGPYVPLRDERGRRVEMAIVVSS